MDTFLAYLLPAVLVIVVWWSSTGIVFYLNSLSARTYSWSLLAAAFVAGLAGCALLATRTEASGLSGSLVAAVAFAAAVAIWGLIEMSFLMGFVTGPRRNACPEKCTEFERFRYAALAIAYHETAIIVTFATLWWVTCGSSNFVGSATFALLWLMRLSTKLNIFFGVPNTAADVLPPSISFLKSYFRTGPVGAFFAVSVSAATAATCVLVLRAAASTSSFDVTAHTILATLAGLGLIEHWFLALPITPQSIWKWSVTTDATSAPNTDGDRRDRALHAGMPIRLSHAVGISQS